MTDKRRRNKREKKKKRLVFIKIRIVYKRKTERSLLINEVDRISLFFKRKKD